ncbi:hypothetical protein SAMN05443377_12617 [Propionibacterium cyclohexanicum]|uniref:Uncharacterized protein n=1 Tax=Propionibacterium cyclohexanicum TaxID=64702 RepID=A0A1H9TPF8_9ACTN|nr:hypothetical protein [Propionibacterium cyclohexanicum]SER99001.1 hypothetical protein SAMN05443377_12617 [Propionibacterium cyclohexanicum]
MSEPQETDGVRAWWWVCYAVVTLAPVVVALWAVAATGAPGNLYVFPITGLVVSAVLAATARGLGAKAASGKTERSLFRSSLSSWPHGPSCPCGPSLGVLGS